MMSIEHTVLVTGATGFLGKVVLEELLRLRANYFIGKVVLLIRSTQEQSAIKRFAQLTTSRCFANLHADWTEGVQVVECDLGLYHCGIQDVAYTHLCETVTHVIHTAGCIKFDSGIADVVSSNIDSSLHVLTLAKDCHNLQQLVITSTAFVSPPQDGPIYETLVELPYPACDLITDIRSGALDETAAITLTGHPNIYSLSKCLGEHIVCQSRDRLPLTIVRPSIICAAIEYPTPGWIDSKAGFAGLISEFGSGTLKVVNGHRATKMDIVPVDKVAGRLIEEAFRHDERRFESSHARIVFSVATTTQSLTLGESCHMIEAFFKKGTFRYIGPKGYMFDVYQFIYHYLRLQLAAVAYRLLGEQAKELAAKQTWRLVTAMNVGLGPYSHHTHDFRPLQPPARFDSEQYFRTICEGVCENLS